MSKIIDFAYSKQEHRGKGQFSVEDWKKSRSVERFDLTRQVWENMPDMQVGRWLHTSTCLGSYLYVFCGRYYTQSDAGRIYPNVRLSKINNN